MRSSVVVLVLIVLAAPLLLRPVLGQDAGEAPAAPAHTDADLLAYGLGFFLGEEVREGLEMDGIKVDADLIVAGFRDGAKALEPAMDRDELDDVLEAVHREMQARMVRRLLRDDPAFRKLHDENKAKSEAYQQAFGSEAGVTTLDNGLQYRVVVQGKGAPAADAERVVATFRGKTIRGNVFAEGENVEIDLDEITIGAAQLIRRMRVGDEWQVAIPPDLAYGAGGNPPEIGPQEVLIGTIELVEVH